MFATDSWEIGGAVAVSTGTDGAKPVVPIAGTVLWVSMIAAVIRPPDNRIAAATLIKLPRFGFVGI